MGSPHLHDHDCDLPEPTLEEVDDGTYVYVQLDGSWGLNNPGFLVGSRGVTVVDTCFTQSRALAFRDALRRVTDRPVQALVNTHHHGDHTFGNGVFRDAAVIGHAACRDEMIAGGFATKALFPGVDWGDIELVPPTVTFDDRLTLWVDDTRVDLLFVGPAHTTNDVVAWLPERRVLFAGDVLFNRCTPFFVMGSLAGQRAALQRCLALEPRVVVPGHGRVCGPDAFAPALAYLDLVERTARSGHEAGLLPLELAREADLGDFASWPEVERLVPNLHRAYAELSGAAPGVSLDYPSVMADMVAYNGGPLRCCA